jgi:truncated hemoglobin YjbI
MLDTLGLSPQDCGKYHYKGRCYGVPNCTRQHTSKTLDPAKVDAVVALFHTGLQHST